MTESSKNAWKTLTEEVEVAGHQLVDEINKLLAEGNVRKLQIQSQQGDVYLNIPVTAGAVAGGVVVLAAPWLALIAAIAAVVAKVRIEIVRDVAPDADRPSAEPPHTEAPPPGGP